MTAGTQHTLMPECSASCILVLISYRGRLPFQVLFAHPKSPCVLGNSRDAAEFAFPFPCSNGNAISEKLNSRIVHGKFATAIELCFHVQFPVESSKMSVSHLKIKFLRNRYFEQNR